MPDYIIITRWKLHYYSLSTFPLCAFDACSVFFLLLLLPWPSFFDLFYLSLCMCYETNWILMREEKYAVLIHHKTASKWNTMQLWIIQLKTHRFEMLDSWAAINFWQTSILSWMDFTKNSIFITSTIKIQIVRLVVEVFELKSIRCVCIYCRKSITQSSFKCLFQAHASIYKYTHI